MYNFTLPKTEAAFDFIDSFSRIKKIIAVSEIIEMSRGEMAEISLERVLNHQYDSKPFLWVDFIFGAAIIYFDDMINELQGWISVNVGEIEEGEAIVGFLQAKRSKLQDKVTHQNILSRIELYNTNLKVNKTKDKEAELLEVDLVNDCVKMVGLILTKFDSYITKVDLLLEKRYEELETNAPVRRGIPVKHKLRWNTNKKDFDEFFKRLIEDKLIQTRSGAGDPEKIMEILYATFDRIAVPKRKIKNGTITGHDLLIKKRIYIPERLIWTTSAQDFAMHFGPIFDNAVIFIDKSGGQDKRPKVSEILQQIIFIEGTKGSDLGNTSLVQYLKEYGN